MAATSPASVRAWRTTFLTLRDETLTSSPKSKSITELVHNLIFSQFESLLSAAPHLPPHEVTSDLLFLVELVANSSQHGPDPIAVVSRFSQLLHDICYRKGVPLRINSSSWTLIINSYATILQFLINKTGPRMPSSSVALTVKPAIECMETVRHIFNTYQHGCMPSDNIQLMSFLIGTIKCCGTQLTSSSHSTASQNFAVASWTTKYGSLWEVQTIAFTMLDDAFRRSGSSIPADIWQSTLEVLRKVMDSVASRSMLVEDHATSKFYVSLLNCLHTVLVDPKGPLHDHVSGFVATLRTFLNYGVTGKTFSSSCCKEKERTVVSSSLNLTETRNKDHAPYRPPHLRNKHFSTMERPRTQDPCSSGHEYSVSDFTSSDSDCSDSDGSGASTDSIRSFKVRIAAISCIQDLCQVDSKSFTTHWTMLLPTTDVLQPKKNEGTLMTCLLFDPCLKARIASASTLSVMLDGPSAVILQVAEYKETTKWGSFMALSSSLGQILMQLHMGVLHLIQHESHSRLLPLLLKILTLLISSTPYQRMPEELLPKVIRCLLARMGIGFAFKNDQTGLLVSTLNCLTAALSTSSSPQVKQMLSEEMSRGANEAKKSSGVLSTLFYHAEQFTSSPICFEALQGLRAVTHNYPMIAFACWDQISDMVSKVLVVVTPEVPRNAWKGAVGDGISYSGEKVITAAVKLLDECLRAVSGFKGTEENFDDKLIETPFLSDSIRTKKISSAPSYELESSKENGEEPKPCPTGNEYWFETIEKHISLLLRHVSPAVRAASVTCFAGITSSVFVSLPKDKQEFMISSMINAALHDGVHSVKSAACRAIGVISCFPQISRSAEILDKFIHAVVINTRDPLVSVRITASWALANICDSLRHCIDEFPLEKTTDSIANVRLMSFLTETALRLTNDGDKIKSNAVRALGNLSRFVRCTSSDLSVHNSEVSPRSNNLQKDQQYPSSSLPARTINLHLLERMVQAFLSCVTTGNVKVQWNVCHAMSNLFLNETIRLQEMDWAPSVFSILLLLLRDSSNYKIRIQAAAALAVPASGLDYGKSFSNVVQGLEHILENLDSVQNSAPSNFKYRDALQKQMTSTMLHVLILASSTDQQPLKDFLVKKASFLEEWLKVISSSLGETSSQQHESEDSREKQKKETISRAIQSLVEIYKSTNHYVIAKKLEKLDNSLFL